MGDRMRLLSRYTEQGLYRCLWGIGLTEVIEILKSEKIVCNDFEERLQGVKQACTAISELVPPYSYQWLERGGKPDVG